MQSVPGAFSPSQRDAAKRLIAEGPDQSSVPLGVLLAFIGHGSPASHQDEVTVIMGLSGERFEQAVIVVQNDDLTHTFWTADQMAEIIRRSADIPSPRLCGFINALRSNTNFGLVTQQAKDVLNRRSEAVAAAAGDNAALAEGLAACRDAIP